MPSERLLRRWWSGAGMVALLAAGSARAAAPLPFEDDFEQTPSFSRWDSLNVDPTNGLTVTNDTAWQGARSLKVVFGGDPSLDQAHASVYFTESHSTAFVRFGVRLGASVDAGLVPGSRVRLLRLSDAPTGSGNVALAVYVVRDLAGVAYVMGEYLNDAGVSVRYGSAAATPLPLEDWQHVGVNYQPSIPRFELFVGDPATPRVSAAPGDMPLHTFWRLSVGSASNATSTAGFTYFIDEVSVSSTGLVPPDAGSDADAGSPDGGTPAAPRHYTVGCGCGAPSSAAVTPLLIALLLAGARRRACACPSSR